MPIGTLLAGWLSDLTNPGRVPMWGCVATVGAGLLLAPLMGSGSLAATFVFLAVALFAMGLVYGPLGAWLPGLFPPQVRYTGTSLSFDFGGVLGGALTPVIAATVAARGGLRPVGLYLAAAAALSLAGLVWAGRAPGARR